MSGTGQLFYQYCSRCGDPTNSYARYCNNCHAAYMRGWRSKHKIGEIAKFKDLSRSYANILKRRGKIAPEPCAICGNSNSQMHYPDHELPGLVVWMCRSCHLDWHSFWKEAAKEIWTAWFFRNSKGQGNGSN